MFLDKHDISFEKLQLAENKLMRKLWCYDISFATLTVFAFKEQGISVKNLLLVFLPILLQMYYTFVAGRKAMNFLWWLSVVVSSIVLLSCSIIIGIMCFTTFQRMQLDMTTEPEAPAIIVITWRLMYHGSTLWQLSNLMLTLITNLMYL